MKIPLDKIKSVNIENEVFDIGYISIHDSIPIHFKVINKKEFDRLINEECKKEK